MPPLLLLACLPLVLVFVVVGFRRPVSVLLPTYAFSVPFGSLLSTGLPPPYDSVSTPLGLLLLPSLAATQLYNRSVRVRFPATVAIWLLFLAVTGASAVWSISPQVTEVAFRNLALLVVLYLLLALTPVDRADLRRVETWLLLGGVVASLYGTYQFVTGSLPIDVEGGGGGRFGRDLLGANNTAAALLMPFAIAFCRAAVWPTVRGRLVHLAAGVMLVFAVLLTGSRGGILAVTALVIVAIVYIDRSRKLLLGYAALAVVGVALVLALHPGGVGGRTDRTNSSGRSDIWKVGLHACHTYCLEGSGWGTFARVYQLEQPLVPDARTLERGVAYEAHNIWILIGIEVGVAGLVLACAGLLLTVRDAYRLPPRLRAPPLAGMVATLIAAFFLSNFEYKFFWLNLMYVLLCRSTGIAGRSAEREGVPRRTGTETVTRPHIGAPL